VASNCDIGSTKNSRRNKGKRGAGRWRTKGRRRRWNMRESFTLYNLLRTKWSFHHLQEVQVKNMGLEKEKARM